MSVRDRRISCADGCGRRILRRHNPSGYCRKCLKLRRHNVAKLEAKKKRERKNE